MLNSQTEDTLENELISMSVVRLIAEERKRADDQREELIRQNRDLIDLLKKGNVLPENNAECVGATGSE